MSAHAGSRPRLPRLPRPRIGASSLTAAASSRALTTLALSAVLVAMALHGQGGLQLGPLTRVEIAADLLAGLLGVLAVLRGGVSRRPWGMLALLAFAALAVITALSVTWALEPADAWREANRTIAWLAVFAGGVALVRLLPERWDSLLHATVLSAVALSLVALATKVFPGALNPDEIYARLREPFGYWNAVGLAAVLGAPGCLWLAARRHGHAAISALAYPAFFLLLVVCLLSYSRGALLALAVGCVVWFVLVPLRLRGVVVLVTAITGAGLVALWAFSQPGLSDDQAELAARTSAGHELGLLVAIMALLMLLAGLTVGFAAARRAPSRETRRAAGVVIAVALALVPVAGLSTLAFSERGLSASVSEGWRGLTDPKASQPTNAPGRLTAVGSVRARYFDEALRMFADEPWLGVGAGGYATARPRYRRDTLEVRHAHGYVVQTLADLGIVGGLASLALLLAWLGAAWRALGGRRPQQTAERVALATMVAVVATFTVHSLVDWTWFVPGTVIVALLCAGWVAGRGPANETFAPQPTGPRSPERWAVATAIAVIAIAAAWSAAQPQRAQNKVDDALALVERGQVTDARQTAREAADVDPLSVDPLFALGAIEQTVARQLAARAAFERAVALQPANVETWLALAQFELDQNGNRTKIRQAIGAALFLDPRSSTAQALALRLARADDPAKP